MKDTQDAAVVILLCGCYAGRLALRDCARRILQLLDKYDHGILRTRVPIRNGWPPDLSECASRDEEDGFRRRYESVDSFCEFVI